ncbi:MAG: DUF4922 domain-containing protein [Proteobacteria bacterium]|nr:DUF4922 domain-containing protein [Pseudomonadota bacterium]
MWEKRIVRNQNLAPYTKQHGNRGLSSRVWALYGQQREAWPEFRRGHDAIREAQTRWVWLESCWVLCQYMPHRIASASARVDPPSIEKRSCFLCPENLYPQEKALAYGEDYFILCNVSPIFDYHVVITHRDHVPQQLNEHFQRALTLARDLAPHFVVIYNGPRCGASAPDHLHFQAFPRDNLPLESQVWVDQSRHGHEIIIESDKIRIAAPRGFSRHFLIFESRDSDVLSERFHQTLGALSEDEDSIGEPMVNLIMGYRGSTWRLILFPRRKHRPQCYYGTQDDQLLISPGAIDMAGMFIIPRKRDYHKVSPKILRDIYHEVTLSERRFANLTQNLRGMT